ncbi:hypothetical protein [Qipengyuania spongiae]|uniref:Uncharacterized protein n=1 Tax=Qipengyuania spongiae TaxID=2909673 RepID=A0ABY5T0D2_9SPHN|nr:hypothetical protein [Qipengyuania spongiae]UVI39959.1 hypothetical protein L1F33_03080 [Qipengyuania spongiae]
MMEAAATVDIAVAGETRTAFGSGSWRLPATTFHVIERLKGSSPDRFTLFVGASGVDDPQLRAMHWVDEKGRITPFPYPVEAEYVFAATRTLTSCHPGFLAVREGEAYLIFRDADGRLLSRFPLYDDLTAAAFPLVRAGLGTREGWAVSMMPFEPTEGGWTVYPTPADRVWVRFPRPLRPSEAASWLEANDLSPFAVRITTGALLDETRVPLEAASRDLLDRAIADARANLAQNPFKALAQTMRAALDLETLERDFLSRRHAWLVAEAGARFAHGAGEPRIAVMAATGSAAAIARLRADPGEADVAAGPLQNGTLYAGISGSTDPQADAYGRETAASLLTRLAAVAEGWPVPVSVDRPPEPESDPFAYGDCIRFGREEAAKLADLPERGRLGELTVFGSPDAATCVARGSTLGCNLAPSSSVRVSWAGWEGGFRIGPRGARLTFDGESLQCPGG